MKNISLMAVSLLGILLVQSCLDKKKEPVTAQVQAAVKYTCPMHSQILEDHPGSCPICGMTLVKKSGQASEATDISLNSVLQPVNNTVISSVNTIVPVQKSVQTNIQADGYLDFDTRTFNNISSRFSGLRVR
ncbi:MAG: heavy metal-binding domain-containing protein [Mucilaginibacter sp.]